MFKHTTHITILIDWLIEEGLTSHQTHYRSYRGRVFTGQMTQPTASKHWRKAHNDNVNWISTQKHTEALFSISLLLTPRFSNDVLYVCAQAGNGIIAPVARWSTKWRAAFRWNVTCSAWSTVRCHRPVTRTTTVRVTRRASSTHTTLRSSPTRPTLSPTAPGAGGAPTSFNSSN